MCMLCLIKKTYVCVLFAVFAFNVYESDIFNFKQTLYADTALYVNISQLLH